MMNGQLKLEPVLSCELANPAVDKLYECFKSGFDILYVYGPPGSGKSLAIDMFVEEQDWFGYKIERFPENKFEANALALYNSLVDNKTVAVIVDGIDQLSSSQLSIMINADWGVNKLILIGAEFKRTGNPFAKVAKSKTVSFKKVKFEPFPNEVISELILRLAAKYRTAMTLDERNKIAEASGGDLRKALDAAKYYILSGKSDLEMFIPNSEEAFYNRVRKIFSGDYNMALEEIETFGWYYSIMILQVNLEGKKNAEDLIDMLMNISMNKMQDRERYLALLACEIQKRYGKGPYPKWVFPKRAKKEEESKIDALCSNSKKEMYFL